MPISMIAAECLLSGLLLGVGAAGTLAAQHHGAEARALLPLVLRRHMPRRAWAGLAALLLLASIALVAMLYDAAVGSVIWLVALAVLGGAAVGLIGAWPAVAGWLSFVPPLLGLLAAGLLP